MGSAGGRPRLLREMRGVHCTAPAGASLTAITVTGTAEGTREYSLHGCISNLGPGHLWYCPGELRTWGSKGTSVGIL